MKYILTGSIGHITKPLAQQLIQSGHQVSIITSKAENTTTIKEMGADALVGSVEDLNFLKQVFASADAAYLMIPPNWNATDWLSYQKQVTNNFIEALTVNNIHKVVFLSSVGAHMRNGAGPVDGLAYFEEKLNTYENIDAVYLRPSYFYYNLFSMIPLIKQAGFMGSNQPESHNLVLTHTLDIADAAFEKLIQLNFKGKEIQYIASDDSHTWASITTTLGEAIGKPDLKWVAFTDEQALAGMTQGGLPKIFAEGYVAMGKALRSKEMEADYWQNKPQHLGKIKLNDFAKEFAAAYNHQG